MILTILSYLLIIFGAWIMIGAVVRFFNLDRRYTDFGQYTKASRRKEACWNFVTWPARMLGFIAFLRRK